MAKNFLFRALLFTVYLGVDELLSPQFLYLWLSFLNQNSSRFQDGGVITMRQSLHCYNILKLQVQKFTLYLSAPYNLCLWGVWE